jgi:hypothetical protein
VRQLSGVCYFASDQSLDGTIEPFRKQGANSPALEDLRATQDKSRLRDPLGFTSHVSPCAKLFVIMANRVYISELCFSNRLRQVLNDSRSYPSENRASVIAASILPPPASTEVISTNPASITSTPHGPDLTTRRRANIAKVMTSPFELHISKVSNLTF